MRGFERAVEACPEVMEMYEMTGASDYLLRVVAADVASYEAFLRGRLVHIPGVQSFESALALKRVVYRTNLPLRQGVRTGVESGARASPRRRRESLRGRMFHNCASDHNCIPLELFVNFLLTNQY